MLILDGLRIVTLCLLEHIIVGLSSLIRGCAVDNLERVKLVCTRSVILRYLIYSFILRFLRRSFYAVGFSPHRDGALNLDRLFWHFFKQVFTWETYVCLCS